MAHPSKADLAVASGIHINLEAFRAVRASASARSFQSFIAEHRSPAMASLSLNLQVFARVDSLVRNETIKERWSRRLSF